MAGSERSGEIECMSNGLTFSGVTKCPFGLDTRWSHELTKAPFSLNMIETLHKSFVIGRRPVKY